MTTIKAQINEDMKTAMRARDPERLGTIRLIMAAMKQKEVDERIELNDDHILVILNKMVKQRRESITQFEAGNRPELAKKESDEIAVIQGYLPAQMSTADIEKAVADAIKESSAESAKDMGKVMGVLKAKLAGKADMTVVSAKVKEMLAG
jgi:uncharacterized protein YqeY